MSEPVKCDGCGAIGLRGLRTPCPPSWFYIRSEDEGGLGAYYVFACSDACRTTMWKPGPGPVLPDAAEAVARLKGQAVSTRPPLWTCPQGCPHSFRDHSRFGCGSKNGHDIYCDCSWGQKESPAVFCEHANETPTGPCPCRFDCYCRSHTCSTRADRTHR